MLPATLFHVDGDSLHTAWLMERVRRMPELRYLGSVRTGRDALAFCKNAAPDILVTELALPDGDGLQVADEIRLAGPAPKVLIFTATSNDWTLFRLCRAPIAGVVWKAPDAAREFGVAMAEIRIGHFYLPSETRAAIAALRSKPDAFFKILSDRELELLPLFGQCMSDDEVGRSASIAPLTARFHRQSIMRKLGIHRHHELISWCLSKGFVSAPRPTPPCGVATRFARTLGPGFANSRQVKSSSL
jgi:DNA-binding NarL/FixJ family response regulator